MVPSTAVHGVNESDIHKQHTAVAASTGAVTKLISEELETALSPLSSSTLTITSLGSTLGLANFGSGRHGGHIKGYDTVGNNSSSSTEGTSSSSTSVKSARSVSSPIMSGTRARLVVQSPEAVEMDTGDDANSNSNNSVLSSSGMRGSSSLPMAETASPASSRIMSVDHAVGDREHQQPMRSVSVDYTRTYASPIQPPGALSPSTHHQGPSSQEDSASPDVEEQQQQPLFAQRLLGSLAKKKSTVLSMAIDSKSISSSPEKRKKQKKHSDSKNRRKTAEADPATAEGESSRKQKQKQKQPASRSVPSKSLDLGRELLSQARGPFNRRAMQRSKREDAIYTASKADAVAMGPARFQQLPRSLSARLGLSSTLASKARRLGDLRFVIAPHASLPEIVEVIDCEEMVPVYRKVSRSGKSWHESFHEVDMDAEGEVARGSWGYGDDPHAMGEYEMAMALGLPYPGLAYTNYGSVSSNASSRPASLRNSAMVNGALSTVAASRALAASNMGGVAQLGASASYATLQTMGDGSESSSSSSGNNGRHGTPAAALSSPSTASFVNAGTVRMGRAQTSVGVFGVPGGAMSMYGMPGTMSMYGGRSASYYGGHQQQQHPLLSPAMMQHGLLWEALTPYPNQFPLHIKDSRKVIDTASLASLVLDRQNFCYRFQLGNNRMRWTAKRIKKSQLALECYVRSALVAEIFVDYEKGYSPYNMLPTKRAAGKKQADSGISTPSYSGSNDYNMYSTTKDDSSGGLTADDGTFPIMTILSSAFTHLAALEEDVVESFIVFSGIQVLEFLHL